ncbi:hypothetical protein N7530_004376 [Penicillium desertorum]|uniref:Uncharacterized protein n=1 Tax=Penicillium desertorum TaxID=1303715 RepID=A0A9X0BQQ0_9EURO|nr:hypothetical protein N7530_004376 [Penicillium desertorum]
MDPLPWMAAGSYLHEPSHQHIQHKHDTYDARRYDITFAWSGTQADPQFAATFGTRFHRFPVPTPPNSGRRSRRHGPNVNVTPVPFPGFGNAGG